MEKIISEIISKFSRKSGLSGKQRDFIIQSIGQVKDSSYQEIAKFYKKKYNMNQQDVYDFLLEQDLIQKETPNREYPHEF